MWDTGHQAYAHKLLTGRLERFDTLRQIDGVGGFPRRSESAHDVMDGGHAGTGLSIAQGLATARDIRHSMERIAVVVGDAALLSGLSLEALNDIGHRQTQLLIVLNDNEMSISPSVGALSKYLSEIKLSPAWQQGKTAYDTRDRADPGRRPARRRALAAVAPVGRLVRPAGPAVRGPRDHLHRRRCPGHDRRLLEETFRRRARARRARSSSTCGPRRARATSRPRRTRSSFHGAALPPMAWHRSPTPRADRRRDGTNGDAMASSAAGGASLTPSREADEGRRRRHR